ncbi:MAG TPA: hypothetical protein VH120_03185 [Gemmataceae bacterium]|jgi:hypothetical protein|nr:hypothetical protein [Gemmataceae bacterium]
MPVWKVMFIALMFFICLALASATLIYPTTVAGAEHPWMWGSCLLAATLFMGTLFTLFLRRAGTAMR